MSKYIKLEDALSEADRLSGIFGIDFNEGVEYGILMTKFALLDLPTIEVSEDCISRADLLSELRKGIECVDIAEYVNDTVWRTIENAPSVVPSRPEGEWVHIAGSGYRCSNCNEYTKSEKPFHKPKGNYCPNCGAKMKGE